MGKGSKRRQEDYAAIQKNWGKIKGFSNKKSPKLEDDIKFFSRSDEEISVRGEKAAEELPKFK